MFTITMSSKGQFVLPKEIREQCKLRPGVQIEGHVDEKGRIVLRPALYEFEDLIRDRPPVTRSASLEEIEEGIAQGAVDSYRRSIGELEGDEG